MDTSLLQFWQQFSDDKEVNHKPAAAEEVDDEGYSVRPQQLGWETEKNNFYSSSDTDSGWKLELIRFTIDY